jgi:3-mercaptopyruvate sulfurtransferase SseA
VPRDREVVAYCRGPYCAFAPEAVAHLRAEGYRARQLEDGLPEWEAAGLPIEAGANSGAGRGGRPRRAPAEIPTNQRLGSGAREATTAPPTSSPELAQSAPRRSAPAQRHPA